MRTLAGLMKQAAAISMGAKQLGTIMFGTVIEIKPLIIQTDDDLTLTHEFLVLSRSVTDYQIVMSFEDETMKQRVKVYDKPEDEPVIKPSDPEPEEERTTDIQFLWTEYRENNNNGNNKEGRQPTRHTINIYNHLEVGERVIMVREEGGQRYFVIDREGIMEDGERCATDKRSFIE